jgi:DNA-binding beta-propeller fold protein YncE
MSDLKECKIINTIENIINEKTIIQTPCGKFLIGTEGDCIFRYNLETEQKFRIAGGINQFGYQDGTRDESRFNYPQGLTLSKDLKTLFVADWGNCVIRTICVGTGITSTFAGQVDIAVHVDGPKEKICFNYIQLIKLSPDGNTLYIADYHSLRTIYIETGQVNTIATFDTYIVDFTLSPDGKHVIICDLNKVLKYNLETGKSEIILEDKSYFGCELSKDGQILFILNVIDKYIKVVNLVTNQVIDTINTLFESGNITISTNGKNLYIIYNTCNTNIQVLDISKYYINFKTFLQLQLSKHSFLSRSVVKRISI